MLWAQVNVIWTGFYRQDCWPDLCSYYCSLCLCCLTASTSMIFIAFCHQDGVLCAQSMCLSSMECLVNFWSRLTSACLSQDCQLFLQTSVIDSRGMDKDTLHSEGFRLHVVCWVFWYLYLIHWSCWICVDLKCWVMHRYIYPFKIFAEPLLVYRTET